MTYALFIGKINCNKIDATRVIPFDRFWYVAFDLHLTPFAIFFYSNFVMKFVKFDANPFMRFDATWLVCIAYSLNKHHSVYFGVDAPISLTFKTKLYFKTVPIFIRLCVWKRDKFKKKDNCHWIEELKGNQFYIVAIGNEFLLLDHLNGVDSSMFSVIKRKMHTFPNMHLSNEHQ